MYPAGTTQGLMASDAIQGGEGGKGRPSVFKLLGDREARGAELLQLLKCGREILWRRRARVSGGRAESHVPHVWVRARANAWVREGGGGCWCVRASVCACVYLCECLGLCALVVWPLVCTPPCVCVRK